MHKRTFTLLIMITAVLAVFAAGGKPADEAPAETFERLMNVEINQLYPVFHYDMYGL